MADIDVVIPVRHGVEFLPEAIASALAQEGAEVRVTIVDDGAGSDLTPLLSRRVRLIRNEGAPGIGGARNTGVAIADAPLLGFLDCDDLWPVDRTRRLIGHVQPGTLAFGAVEEFGDRDRFRVVPAPARAALPGTMLMATSDWSIIGQFDESLTVGEFIDWMSRARVLGMSEAHVDVVALRRRLHGDNTTLRRRDQRLAYAEVVRRHLARRPDGTSHG